MQKTTLILLLLFLNVCTSQVGILTTNPTSTLDINGDLRIRSTAITSNESAAKDSILVVDNNGNSKRVTSKTVVNSYLKTFLKGHFSNNSTLTLNLSDGRAKLGFNTSVFDMNSEFNTYTNTFTAKQAGIYNVAVQIKANNSSIGVNTNFGVGIAKNGTIINRDNYATISIFSTNVTPPTRQIETLVALEINDTISFEIIGDLSTVAILANSEDTFFTIYQLR